MRLGDVCGITMGQSPDGESYNTDGKGEPLLNGPTEFGVVNPTPTQWTTTPTRFSDPGDVLLCVRGATTGRKNIADRRYCIGRGLAALRGEAGRLEQAYLWFALDVVVHRFLEESAGSTFPNLPGDKLGSIEIPLPPLPTQRRIAAQLKAQLAEVERARAALQAQLDTVDALVAATLRESLAHGGTTGICIGDCLQEVTQGIGPEWTEYPVLGATRAGLAPAKEPVGKAPERYKPVRVGTVFYNPMRILLGSIAMVDEGDSPGITSPDYVVMTARDGVLHPRWFYQWFRSGDGAAFVSSLTRGAVRERLLFKRLAPAEIRLPPWSEQARAAEIFGAVAAIRKQSLVRLATLDRLPAALLRQVFGETEHAGKELDQ
jgi:type I restriction enzyme S subunit